MGKNINVNVIGHLDITFVFITPKDLYLNQMCNCMKTFISIPWIIVHLALIYVMPLSKKHTQ